MTDIVDYNLKDIRHDIECTLDNEYHVGSIKDSIWKSLMDTECFKTLTATALRANYKGLDRVLKNTLLLLAAMARGAMIMDTRPPEPAPEKKYKKTQAQAQFKEVFFFVQEFARGGKHIFGEELNGELKKPRNLKQLHPDKMHFTWKEATTAWNNAHPAKEATEKWFKNTYYNAEDAGMGGEFLSMVIHSTSMVHQSRIDDVIWLIDEVIEYFDGLNDDTEENEDVFAVIYPWSKKDFPNWNDYCDSVNKSHPSYSPQDCESIVNDLRQCRERITGKLPTE